MREALTAEEIDTYRSTGGVVVRGGIDQTWLSRLRPIVDRLVVRPGTWASDTGEMPDGGGRSLDDRYLWRENETVRSFVLESGLGALVGEAMGSREVRFYFDHWLVKEPGSRTGTPWHQDVTYWPFDGKQIASIWIPFTPVDRGSSTLEIVKGSHVWNKRFRPERFVPSDDKSSWIARAEGEALPDIQAGRGRYEILSPSMRPGDLLIFSAWSLHSATPNRSSGRRAALSTRWLGDDVVWRPHEAADPTVSARDVSLEPGELARDDDRFPVAWRREMESRE